MKRKLGLLMTGILFVQSVLMSGVSAATAWTEVESEEFSSASAEYQDYVDVNSQIWESETDSESMYFEFSEEDIDFPIIESPKIALPADAKIIDTLLPTDGPLPFLEQDETDDVNLYSSNSRLSPQPEVGRTSQVSITNGLNSLFRISINGGGVQIRGRQTGYNGKGVHARVQRNQYNTATGQISSKFPRNSEAYIFENEEVAFSIPQVIDGMGPASGSIEYYDLTFYLENTKGEWISAAGARIFREGDSLYFRKNATMLANRSALAAITDQFTPASRLAMPANSRFTPIFQVTDQLIAGKTSDLDKIKAIHDWVAGNIHYDFVTNNDDKRKFNPVETFEDRIGVCSGISRLFMIMARRAGVPTVTVAGLSNSNWTGYGPYYLESSRDASDHEWNAVYLDGVWQYIDPTWNCRNRYELVNGKPTLVKGDIDYTFFLPDEYSFHLNHRADMIYTGDTSGDYTTNKYPAINKAYANSRAPVNVSGISVVPNISVLRMTRPTQQFDAIVSPSNAYEKEVTWSLENNSAGASISGDGLLTVTRAGKVTVAAAARDGSGIRSKLELTVLNPNRTQIEAFVTRMYSNIMGRAPDADGLRYWTDGLMSGTQTGTSISGFFLKDADELKKKNLSNEKYVEIVYVTAFGRSPDPEGQKYWTDMLSQGGTRDGIVAKMLVAGEEFANICFNNGIDRGPTLPIPNRDRNPQLTAFVARMYTEILGRAYEDGGLDFWTEFMLNSALPMKDRISQLSRNFVFSKEFTDKNHSNTEFVRRMYLTFMNRSPDAGGQSHWVGLLNNGSASRESVFTSFLNSQEFTNIIRSYGLM